MINMKKLKIKIGKDMLDELRAVYYSPSKASPGTHTLFLKTAEDLYEILSPKRLELLQHIIANQSKKKTISKIATELKRKQEAISRDANILAKYQIIKKTKQRQMVYIKPLYKSLEIELASA